jgi:hypothetical protein
LTGSFEVGVALRRHQEFVQRLVAERRRFTKGLRNSLAADLPIASAVLSDVEGGPVALYVVPPSADAVAAAKLTTLVEESELASWIWHGGGDELPQIPSLPGRIDRPLTVRKGRLVRYCRIATLRPQP